VGVCRYMCCRAPSQVSSYEQTCGEEIKFSHIGALW
jgi:hypothetical protein